MGGQFIQGETHDDDETSDERKIVSMQCTVDDFSGKMFRVEKKVQMFLAPYLSDDE